MWIAITEGLVRKYRIRCLRVAQAHQEPAPVAISASTLAARPRNKTDLLSMKISYDKNVHEEEELHAACMIRKNSMPRAWLRTKSYQVNTRHVKFFP